MTIRALVIAIEDYPHAQGIATKLAGTRSAGEAFMRWLVQSKSAESANLYGCGVAGPDGRGSGTTKAEILQQCKDLVAAGRDASTELYVFFAGHGFSFEEGPGRRPADILIGSEFVDVQQSGGACIRLRELQETLQSALGPCETYYFVDACRNLVSEDEIDPTSLGVRFGQSENGIKALCTLFSTAPADRAAVGSGFTEHLIAGLAGKGRAKEWLDEARLAVTFDRLSKYVRTMMPDQTADVRVEGFVDGYILEIKPVMPNPCTVTVLNADDGDQFSLTLKNKTLNTTPSIVQSFVGGRFALEVVPADYQLEVKHQHRDVVQRKPASKNAIDAYDACAVELELMPAQPSTGSFESPSMGFDSLPSFTSPSHGELFNGREAMFGSASIEEPEQGLGLRDLGLVSGVEGKGPTPAAMLLSLLGATHIVNPSAKPPAAAELTLQDLGPVKSGSSAVYVLAFFTRPVQEVRVGLSEGDLLTWRALRPVEGVHGLWDGAILAEPGAQLFSLEVVRPDSSKRVPTTLVSHALPNRATLLTITDENVQRFSLNQYFLPLAHLSAELPEAVRAGYGAQQRIETLWQVQHDFAHKLTIEKSLATSAHGQLSDWTDALHGKWLDPCMALFAGYELLRRRERGSATVDLRQIIDNLRQYFAGISDIEILAKQAGLPFTTPSTPPLILDGFLALEEIHGDVLPLSQKRLTYDGPWLTWRKAVSVASEQPAAAALTAKAAAAPDYQYAVSGA